MTIAVLRFAVAILRITVVVFGGQKEFVCTELVKMATVTLKLATVSFKMATVILKIATVSPLSCCTFILMMTVSLRRVPSISA